MEVNPAVFKFSMQRIQENPSEECEELQCIWSDILHSFLK